MITMTPVMRTCLIAWSLMQYSRAIHKYRSVHASRMGMASGAGINCMISYRGVCMHVRGLEGLGGVLGVVLLQVGAFPIGRP